METQGARLPNTCSFQGLRSWCRGGVGSNEAGAKWRQELSNSHANHTLACLLPPSPFLKPPTSTGFAVLDAALIASLILLPGLPSPCQKSGKRSLQLTETVGSNISLLAPETDICAWHSKAATSRSLEGMRCVSRRNA